jgi:hypothetical protein
MQRARSQTLPRVVPRNNLRSLQWIGIASKELEDDKIVGKREQLEGKIQERAGITKDAARKSVDDWLNKQ